MHEPLNSITPAHVADYFGHPTPRQPLTLPQPLTVLMPILFQEFLAVHLPFLALMLFPTAEPNSSEIQGYFYKNKVVLVVVAISLLYTQPLRVFLVHCEATCPELVQHEALLPLLSLYYLRVVYLEFVGFVVRKQLFL